VSDIQAKIIWLLTKAQAIHGFYSRICPCTRPRRDGYTVGAPSIFRFCCSAGDKVAIFAAYAAMLLICAAQGKYLSFRYDIVVNHRKELEDTDQTPLRFVTECCLVIVIRSDSRVRAMIVGF